MLSWRGHVHINNTQLRMFVCTYIRTMSRHTKDKWRQPIDICRFCKGSMLLEHWGWKASKIWRSILSQGFKVNQPKWEYFCIDPHRPVCRVLFNEVQNIGRLRNHCTHFSGDCKQQLIPFSAVTPLAQYWKHCNSSRETYTPDKKEP